MQARSEPIFSADRASPGFFRQQQLAQKILLVLLSVFVVGFTWPRNAAAAGSALSVHAQLCQKETSAGNKLGRQGALVLAIPGTAAASECEKELDSRQFMSKAAADSVSPAKRSVGAIAASVCACSFLAIPFGLPASALFVAGNVLGKLLHAMKVLFGRMPIPSLRLTSDWANRNHVAGIDPPCAACACSSSSASCTVQSKAARPETAL